MKISILSLLATLIGSTYSYAGPDIRWYKSGACEVMFEDGSKVGGTDTNEQGDTCCLISHGIDNNICYTEFEYVGPETHEDTDVQP